MLVNFFDFTNVYLHTIRNMDYSNFFSSVDVLFGNRNEFRAFVSSSRRLGYKSAILNGIMSVVDRLDRPQVITEEKEEEEEEEEEKK